MNKSARFLTSALAIALVTSPLAACGFYRSGAPTPAAPNQTAKQAATKPGTVATQLGAKPGTTIPRGVGSGAGLATAPGATGVGRSGVMPAQRDLNHLADQMAIAAKRVPGVTKATVIVHNRDAIVGIDVAANQNRRQVEKKVRTAVSSIETGYTVHVTSDKQLHARIRDTHTRLSTGHPIRTLATDVGVLIRDIGRAVTAPFR